MNFFSMCGVGLEQSVGGQAQYSTTACPAGVMPGKVFPACAKTRAKKKRPAGLFLVFCFWLLAIDCCYYFFWLVFVVVISFLFLLLITKHAPCQFCQPVEK